MGFEDATMNWQTKKTTISHTSHEKCGRTPWRVRDVGCGLHFTNGHLLPAGPWKLGPAYTPTPVGSVAPKGMDTTLELSTAGMSQADLETFEQHFRAKVQLKLTIRFGNGDTDVLKLNLSLV